jgi:hypothetical protein
MASMRRRSQDGCSAPRTGIPRTPRRLEAQAARDLCRSRYDLGPILPQGSGERNTKPLKPRAAAVAIAARDRNPQLGRCWYFHFEESL